MKKIIIIILTLLIVGCEKEMKEKTLDEVLKENNYIIVDVRTNVEYTSGHIKGAINIPYDQINEELLDKNKTIIVYCKSGNRSSKAKNTLVNLGYKVLDLGAYESINLEKE